MAVFVVIFLIIIVIVIGFLYTPVKVYIDTDQSRYEFFQLPVFHFAFIHSNDRFFTRVRLLGININVANQQKKKSTKVKSVKSKRRLHRSVATWHYLFTRMIRSFNVNKAVLDVDTGDVVLNAQLIPLFAAVSGNHVHINSNFNGRLYFHLEMSNLPAKLLWIFVQFLIKK